jgi:hypothetical protein
LRCAYWVFPSVATLWAYFFMVRHTLLLELLDDFSQALRA